MIGMMLLFWNEEFDLQPKGEGAQTLN